MADSAKYVTTKYGTRINVTGLTPEQAKKVLSVAQDKGAYGTKGAALADTFRKQNTKAPAGKPGQQPTGPNLGIDPNTGKINPTTATDTVTNAVGDDTQKNFNMNNPTSQTDVSGNSRNIEIDPTTGQVKITDKGGATLSAAQQAFLGAASDFGANGKSQRQAATDAAYGYITKDYATAKAQEMEKAKQELAQRGIPLDPSPDSLYGRTLAQIDKKYQAMDDSAKQQAISTGNTEYATDAGVVSTLGGTVTGQTPNFTPYQGGQSNQGAALLSLLGTISDADLKKYGIDQDTMLKLKALAKSGSGGSSGSSDPNAIIGGTAPGFGV